jgi:hypothetical protein
MTIPQTLSFGFKCCVTFEKGAYLYKSFDLGRLGTLYKNINLFLKNAKISHCRI